MFKPFKTLFNLLTPKDVREHQLHEAKMTLLQAEAHSEYYTAMAEAMRKRIARLENSSEKD